MIIRDEKPIDGVAIRKLVEAAFGQKLEADLVDGLRSEGDICVSLVAEEQECIVGHVVLSKMSASFRALGLAPDRKSVV